MLALGLSLGLSAGLPGAPAHAAQYQGFTFDEQIRLDNAELRLNGLGMRAVFVIKAYAAGLYLTQKADTGEAALRAPGPKRIQIRMMREATAADFQRALVSGMRKNASEAELARLHDRLLAFEQTLAAIGTVKKGDTINLDWLPGRGLVLTVNGKVEGKPVEGADFFGTLLEIFVGDRPVDANLKKGLLGQPAG